LAGHIGSGLARTAQDALGAESADRTKKQLLGHPEVGEQSTGGNLGDPTARKRTALIAEGFPQRWQLKRGRQLRRPYFTS
jgi:hypothetical protein